MAINSENKFSPLQRLTKPATYEMFIDVIISTGCPPPSPFTHRLTVISTGCLPPTLFTHRLALSPPSTPVQSETDWPPPPPQFTHRLIGKVCDDVMMWIASNSRVCSFDQVAAPLQRFQKKKVKKIVKLSTWVSWISYCLHRRWWLKHNKALFFI